MADWRSSMEQTYEYYVVDPGTWNDIRRIDHVIGSSITRDSSVMTLGSATIDMSEAIDECYIRIYLITIQNGVKERHPLGTFLVQTPGSDFDGKLQRYSLDAYTPLLELKEKLPPLGYSIRKDKNIMDEAYRLTRENVRAPVVKATCDKKLYSDFVAEPNDSWITFVTDLLTNAKYEFALDELGRIMYSPKQNTASLQPVWTYNDDDKSILYHEVSVDRDLYNVPNVVEVIYSNGGRPYYARVVNDDSNSPTSTVNRGREILHRVTDPNMIGNPTDNQIQEYAEQLLRELSTLEYTISYSHGYCPVRLGDCVRINYTRAGLVDVKAKVISQTIKCESGCPVSEKAVFTRKLWG